MKKTSRLLAILGISLALMGSAEAQKSKKSARQNVKFLDDIEISVTTGPAQPLSTVKEVKTPPTEDESINSLLQLKNATYAIEKAGEMQFKYAILLNTEVEMITNMALFSAIDQWFGTRYRLGGEDKNGIDCSALMQALYASVYNTSLPRTAREIYKVAKAISRTELREGDLVFFNTTGGVSHIGLYLQNNKFLHASSSEGVTISDLYESYWSRRFIGVGRIEPSELPSRFSKP